MSSSSKGKDPLRNRSTRKKKPTTKLIENADGTTADGDVRQKWCRVYCDEDARAHVISARNLEPEDSEALKESHLCKGNTLLWKLKGKRYTTTLLEVHDSKPPNKREHKVFKEDSSSSDNDDEKTTTKKKKSSEVVVEKVYGYSSESEVADNEQDANGVIEVGTSATTSNSSLLGDVASCSCKEELSELAKTVATNISALKTSIAGIALKIDRVYAAMKQPMPPSIKITAPTTSSSQSSDVEVKDENDSKYVSETGVRLLTIRALNPTKYTLALMDALFSDEEMGSSCFSSKRGTKPQLPQAKIKLIEDCVDMKYGRGTFLRNEHDINKRCNQKCIDVGNKLKRLAVPAEGAENEG